MKQETAKRRLALAAACAAFVLGAAACGSSGSSGSGSSDSGSSGAGSEETVVEQSGGMDHSGMDHGSMDMASMLEVDGEYSDERFIDLMVPHHEGAVEMAEVALDGNAEREEIVRLSEEIIRTQNAEIEELLAIKQEEFGNSEIPESSMDEMGMMGMSSPEELAGAEPFDLAYIDDMTPHHESAVEMAEVALQETENERIQTLAEEIISAQERELQQMSDWRAEWYPNA